MKFNIREISLSIKLIMAFDNFECDLVMLKEENKMF